MNLQGTPRVYVLLAAGVLASSVLLRVIPAKAMPVLAGEPAMQLTGEIPRVGSALVTSVSGGSIRALSLASSAAGCSLSAFETTLSDGRSVRFTFGALPSENRSLVLALPDGRIPVNAPLLLDCR